MPDNDNRDRLSMAQAEAVYRQARKITAAADALIAKGLPKFADCAHDGEPQIASEIYQNEPDGVIFHADVEKCRNCGGQRLVARFPGPAPTAHRATTFYSEWTPAMTGNRRAQALSDITVRIMKTACDPDAADNAKPEA